MQTARNQHAESLRDAVESYVHAMTIPALDRKAIAARRGTRAIAQAPRRLLLATGALATAAALAVFLTINAPAVVAGMQRVFAAFALVGGQTVPMRVRDVDLAQARADVPFELIVPPPVEGTTLTLHEMLSDAAPASDAVLFNLHVRRGNEISIVETSAAGGALQFSLTEREPGRGETTAALMPNIPLPNSAGRHVSVVGNDGNGLVVPLTWVTRGTRIVLLSPPGVLSDTQLRLIRAAMSN